MAETKLFASLRHLFQRMGRGKEKDQEDSVLLEAFSARSDQDAFAALTQRHGSMVMGVCRRILANSHDAEEAFQATFLILAKKAASLDWTRPLAPWLYTVAYNVSLKAKARMARNRSRGEAPLDVPVRDTESSRRELKQELDEGLAVLPERYRAPLVLVYLQEKTHDQAARELGCPRGSVAKLVAGGLERLRGRMEARGIAFSAALLAGVACQASAASVPPALIAATARASVLFAGGQAVPEQLVSSQTAELARAVLAGMGWFRVKVAAVLIALATGLAGVGVLAQQSLGQPGNETSLIPIKNAAVQTQPPQQTRTARAQPQLLFADDFERGNLGGGWQKDRPQRRWNVIPNPYGAGKVLLCSDTGLKKWNYLCVQEGNDWADYAAEVSVLFRKEQVASAAILARTAKADGKALSETDVKYDLILSQTGDPTAPAKLTLAIHLPPGTDGKIRPVKYRTVKAPRIVPGRWYRLRLEVHGSELRGHVDGVHKVTLSSSVNPRGGVSLGVLRVDGPNNPVYFDNLRVESIPPLQN